MMDKQTRQEVEQSVGYMRPHLEALQVKPESLIDIGAAHGYFSMLWSDVFDSDQITMIEANPLSCSLLDNEQATVIQAAIGKPGKATFYTNPNEPVGGGSSLFLENTEWFEGAEKRDVDVISLDSLDLTADMIKIDIQGGEYDAISYGVLTAMRAKYLLLELSFLEYNKGAPLIDDVLELTRLIGFRMIDTFGPVLGGHWHKGKKNQVDVLLAKKDLPIYMV